MNLVDLFPSLNESERKLLVRSWNNRSHFNKRVSSDLSMATFPFADIDLMLSALRASNRDAPEYYSTTLDKLIKKLNRHKDEVALESLGLKVLDWNDP